MSFALCEWTQESNGPLMGQYQFPFNLLLPKWLPESMLIAEPTNKLSLECRYVLVTQLEPWDLNGWVASSQKLGMSKVRHEQSFFIFNKVMLMECPVEATIKTKVGGFFGLFTS